MRAALLHRYNEPVVVEELARSELGPHDVRVQVAASGVCHSDLSVVKGGAPVPTPVILGREGTGTVVEVGAAVLVDTKGHLAGPGELADDTGELLDALDELRRQRAVQPVAR